MKRWVTTFAAVLFCSSALHADITIVQSTTVEGGMAAMAAQSGANVNPRTTQRIKGMKSRTDIEAGPINISTIVDLDTKQVIILNAAQKTATISTPGDTRTPPPATTTGPTVDGSLKPTGKSQVVDGIKLDEYTFNTSVDMSTMGGANVPPEAAAMMQGVKMLMNGSFWVGKDVPGAEEYLAYQKAANAANMLGGAAANAGMNVPGMEKMTKAMAGMNGLTYLTEMTMTIEGTGQMADMMRQMGPMKVTRKVSSVSSEKIGDDQFKVPEGYTTIKQ
jgi:hypothetical protein